MLTVVNVITFFWLGLWALWACRRLLGRSFSCVSLPILVVFLVNGLPLLLDETVGKPDYPDLWGIKIASRDSTTGFLYCLYLMTVPVILWAGSKLNYRKSRRENIRKRFDPVAALFSIRHLLLLFMVSPILFLPFAPEPKVYLDYAWFLTTKTTVERMEFHFYLELLTNLSLIGSVGLLTSKAKLKWFDFALIIPWVAIAAWLNGKRFIVVLGVVLIWLALTTMKKQKASRSLVLPIFLICGLIIFSFGYQMNIRQVAEPSELYENYRGDFGRDGVTKLAIFAELNPDAIKILEYRGQSLVFYATILVPRSFWPDKPAPYANYVTAAAMLVRHDIFGWGLTSTWLDEALANFSWFGLLIGPLLPALICRIGDKASDKLVPPLSSLVASLFLVLHLTAFFVLFVAWSIAVLKSFSDRILPGRNIQFKSI